MPRGGAVGSAQGPDGEPDNRLQRRGAAGARPAPPGSHHRRGLQPAGPGPGRAAAEAGSKRTHARTEL